MADTAFQVQYRQEFIATFEQHQSLLRDVVTTEAVIKGNQATFLVAGSGGATAQTRGVNGLIAARGDDLTQTTATLVEWHDLVRKTNFNIFASQGNQRQIMQSTTMGVVNRVVDDQIIDQLATGTIVLNTTPVTASVELVLRARAVLTAAKVPWDGNITLLASAGMMTYLQQAPEFSKGEYVSLRPFETGGTAWRDVPMGYRWNNILIIEHPMLSLNTSAEKCYMFHKSAIGHAVDTAGIQSPVGYNEEQDYSWARCSVNAGAKLLQNSGVVVINHDSSAIAPA
ncbi:MAG: phage capsid protein [Reyranella sp.]|uniref:phage capsid protein n=1 Tax=Reyranella sp. TaxID=1929291 RepID=UPI003D0EDD9E